MSSPFSAVSWDLVHDGLKLLERRALMRGLILGLAGAASVVLAISPAGAQYYGQRYGYSGYGYNGGYADPSSLEQRIYNVLRSLDGVAPYEREQLRGEALSLARQLRYAARNGLTRYEAHNFDVRIGELERHQLWAGRSSQGYGYGDRSYYGNYHDRGHGRGHHDDGDDGNDD